MSVESCSPPSSNLSSISDDHSSVIMSPSNSPVQKVPCQICRIQSSAVVYFNVPVCSGCRAFFRRTVKKGKKYQCLNSRLCGNNLLVPNRRVCKYCRFNRCIQAGMLNAKLRLQNRINDSNQQFTSANEENLSESDVLKHLQQLKLTIREQRNQLYNQVLPQQSFNGIHDMKLQFNEHILFNHTVATTQNLFSALDKSDWNTLSIFEYSMWWILIEQIQLIVQNCGHQLQRVYNFDGSYNQVDIESTRKHWECIREMIDSENKEPIWEVLVGYLNGLQSSMINNIGITIFKAQLDEVEFSALMLLLMTRPACLEIVENQKSKQYLQWLRNQTLKSLAIYLNEIGQNVDERMGQLIFLTSDFQSLGRLVKHSTRLLMTATRYRIVPNEFLGFFQQQLQLYDKYAVF